MSYDIYFWREESNSSIDRDEICGQIADGEIPDKLLPISLSYAKELFFSSFPLLSDEGNEWNLEDEDSWCFQATWLDMFEPDNVASIVLNCAWGFLDSGDYLNKLIDISAKLGCVIFDPQEGAVIEPRQSL